MSTHLLAALLAARFLLSPPAPPDPCALVSAAQIASALGKSPSPGEKTGPAVDPESGATVATCSLTVGDWFFSIEVAEFAGDAAAAAALTEAEKVSREVEEAMRMSPQPGLGEGALWGSSW